MEILIVEDDPRMAGLLERGLEREGHATCIAADGPDGFDFASSREFDVVVLDVMLPKMNGLEVVRRLREEGCQAPVLMLTAKDAPKDIVQGLDSGADDYLTKPFSFEELLARIRAVARRSPVSREATLRVGPLELDPASHEVSRGSERLMLTPREFQILELLMRRHGIVLSRDVIIDAVWGLSADVEHNTVEVFIANLRRKLDSGSDERLLHTVRGVGYCLKAEPP